jgi:hypothetical protein
VAICSPVVFSDIPKRGVIGCFDKPLPRFGGAIKPNSFAVLTIWLGTACKRVVCVGAGMVLLHGMLQSCVPRIVGYRYLIGYSVGYPVPFIGLVVVVSSFQ